MTVKINFKALALAVVSATVATMTANCTIDNYITFAGEINAAAFFLVAATCAALATYSAFEIVNH